MKTVFVPAGDESANVVETRLAYDEGEVHLQMRSRGQSNDDWRTVLRVTREGRLDRWQLRGSGLPVQLDGAGFIKGFDA